MSRKAVPWLRRPCDNCPFLKQGAIELAPGRLDGIIHGLQSDFTVFHCHKTVHSSKGGEWDDDGNYSPSGNEALCMGSLAYAAKGGCAMPVIARWLIGQNANKRTQDIRASMELVIDPPKQPRRKRK